MASRPSAAVVPARLPLAPLPEPDETFTSWMLRTAVAHGLRPRSLCSLLTGRQIEFTGDFDGPIGEPLLAVLAKHTGLDAAALRAGHTLVGFAGRLFPRHRPTTATPWVLPLGPFYTRRAGAQFCPECLGQEPAYLRRIWRLSLFGTCPVHGTGYHHVCPSCAAPFNAVRNQMFMGTPRLTCCWQCGFDARKASPLPVAEGDVHLARALRGALEEGITPLGFPSGLTAADYFDGLALLCARILRRQPRLADWRQLVAAAADVPVPPDPACRGTRAGFDTFTDPAARRPVLRMAAWLLEDWPERFLTLARAGQTRTSDFIGSFAAAPNWMLEPLRTRLTPPRPKQKFSAGVMRLRRMREFILTRRHEWCPTKLPRLARALREAGFYEEAMGEEFIIVDAQREIAKLRANGQDYRKRITQQVPRDTPEWSRLILLARPYRKTHCSSAECLRRGIRSLCAGRFLSSRDLGELLHRSPQVLMACHLVPMVLGGTLRMKFGQNRGGFRNFPGQAYKSA